MQVLGYGSTFGGEPDAYGDIIEPGAFSRSLKRHQSNGTLPKMFWAHDSAQLAGAWSKMYEDTHGLVTDGKLAPTTLGNDLDALIEMKALDALSIGFYIPQGGSQFDRNGVRVIKEIELVEVSLVSLPANPRARLASAPKADSLTDALAKLQEFADRGDNVVELFPNKHNDTHDEDDALVDALNALSTQIRRKARC